MREKNNQLDKISVLLATLFYAGHFPWIPGTIGSLLGLLLYIFLFRLSPFFYALDLITLMLFSIWVSERAERAIGQRDSKVIIIDEFVGILVTMCWIYPAKKALIGGFLLFRFFDITKPPPIRFMERSLPGGYGVVMDDVIAGIYSNLSLRGLLFFWN